MTATETMRERTLPPRWYWWYAGGIGLVATIGLILGVVGIYVNNRQDATADATTRHLLACFDRYASQSAQVSSAVRDASVAKDAATAKFNDSLKAEGEAFLATVDKILDQSVTPADVQNLRDALEARKDAALVLDKAQDRLDEARKDNPVPLPPSVVCDDR